MEISHQDTHCALHLHLGKPISARISHIHVAWIQAKKPLQPAILGCSTKLFQEPNFSELQELLEEVLRRKIELVPRKYLSPYIGPHILKEVELILE